MPRSGSKKALPSELSGVRDLCKLPNNKAHRDQVLSYLKNNRHYISVLAASAAELRAKFAPNLICVALDIVGSRPVITVSAESEDVDVQAGLEEFMEEFYDPISIDLGMIRFEADLNWASTRVTRCKLGPKL